MRKIELNGETKSAFKEALNLLTPNQFDEFFEVLENQELQKLVADDTVSDAQFKHTVLTIRSIKQKLSNLSQPK